MVVADQGNWVADVVIVVEGTANLSPYVESLKSHYIVPTLEYFNGGQIDDRDCGYDSNSTTYALVVFMASDCAPEPAAICHAPTTNVAKLLSWFDRVSFALREPGSVVQKHCILVCNSPPYRLPTLESPMYAGHSVEQLATIMAERQVNFSILSPRKIPALYKLYEKAGGDLQTAMCKNYAKDRRHMVLLRGYQLQERPKRPAGGSPPNPREAKMFKQPTSQASPISTMGGSPPAATAAVPEPGCSAGHSDSACPSPGGHQPTKPTQCHIAADARRNEPDHPESLTSHNRAGPLHCYGCGVATLAFCNASKQEVRQERYVCPGASSRRKVWCLRWSRVVRRCRLLHPPTQTSMPLLASQLSNAPMASGPPQQMRPTHPTPVSCATGPQMQTGFRGPSMRMGVPPGGGPPGVVGQGGNPLVGAGSQMSQQGMPPTGPAAPPSSTLAAQLSQMPQGPPPQQPPQGPPMMGGGGPPQGMQPQQQQQQPPPGAGPAASLKERRVVWQGQVEYQDKMPGNPRNVYTLQCSIFASVINGEPEICADKWPPKLTLQLMPRSMLMNVVLAVKNASRGVVMSFEPGEGLVKLSRFMGSAWLGLVHFASPPADLKLMLVVYMADKNLFMGMVANDQEGLFAAVKQVIDAHRKQQQSKTKMLQNMSGGTMAPAGGMNMAAPVPNATMGIAPAAPGQQYSAAMWPGNNILAKTLMPPEQQGPPATAGAPPQGGPPGPPQVPPQGLPPGAQAAAVSQQQANRLSQLEAERQQNLLKIQQLQQTLEAAQAKELQYKELQYKQAQEQQSLLERQRVVTHQAQQQMRQQQMLQNLQQQSSIRAQLAGGLAMGGDLGHRALHPRVVAGPAGTTRLS
ncbi:hypothetical protein MRX96_039069 [Rhipicephalus microplus]